MVSASAVVFVDFDGTITLRDATDAILDAFADPQWLEIERAWSSELIGSRECLAGQMALVTATKEQIDGVLDDIDVDRGFATLLDACAGRAVPVHIVSDGFDYCIDRILQRPDLGLAARLTNTRVVSSSLRPCDGRWRATFHHPLRACAHGCATCKPEAMEHLSTAGDITVFVGDGLSDRYAALHADIVFAKHKLAEYCDSAAIPYARYDTLATVASKIVQLLSAGPPWSGSGRICSAV